MKQTLILQRDRINNDINTKELLIQNLQLEIDSLKDERKIINEKLNELPYLNTKPETFPWTNLLQQSPDTRERHKEFQQAVQILVKGTNSLQTGSYAVDTDQRMITIHIIRELATPTYLATLENAMAIILPYIIPRTLAGITAKYFKLIEPSLSYHGVYYVQEHNGIWSITSGQSRQRSVLFHTPSLNILINYLKDYFSNSYNYPDD